MTLQDLFSRDGSWTKREFARDKFGDRIYPGSDYATCFCIRGGIDRVCGDDFYKADKMLNKLLSMIDGPLTKWNDAPERTVEDVRDLVKKANV